MQFITELKRNIPVVHETDIAVIGGSCTGVFSAVLVMVNMNQTGEAAGVASVLAMKDNCAICKVNPQVLRQTLADGGSIIF